MAQRQPAALHWTGKVPLQCHPKNNLFWENTIFHLHRAPPLPLPPAQSLEQTQGEQSPLPPGHPFYPFAKASSPLCPSAPVPAHLAPSAHPGEPAVADGTITERNIANQGYKSIHSAQHERTKQTKGATGSESLESRQGPSTTPEFWKESQDPPPAAWSEPRELQDAATAVFLCVHLLQCIKSPGGRHSKHKQTLEMQYFLSHPS